MHRANLLGVLAVATCGAALGCAFPSSATYSAINAPPRPFVRRAPAEVEVTVGSPPTRAHVDVGLFEVDQGMNADGGQASTEEMIATLRLHAALRGCDAVQVMNVDIWGRSGWHTGWRVLHGVCQMYTDEQAQQAAGPAKVAPPPPLAGEGKSCVVQPDASPDFPSCPAPLVCSHSICASPYQ